MSTITITRAERDLILAQLWRFAPGLHDDPLPFDTHDEAAASIRRIKLAMALRDELGWDDDDPRATFTVTPDPLLIEALNSEAESWAAERENEIEYRETHILGMRPTRHGTTWSDDYATIEEANTKVDEQIRVAEKQQRACEELIRRMNVDAAVTA